MEVDAACAEINRYYVISRPEDVGRLSLNKMDDYPELIEIVRKPLDLRRITFLDTFKISLERSDREGKKMDHIEARGYKVVREAEHTWRIENHDQTCPLPTHFPVTAENDKSEITLIKEVLTKINAIEWEH